MGRKMQRGKQQIMFNYLPGKTFDFERVATIAKVANIRGVQRTDLNAVVLLRNVADEARAWRQDFRPLLRDDVLRDTSRFVLLDPQSVQSEIFPKVLWCQNRVCGRVFDFTGKDSLPKLCPTCKRGELMQLRWVKIHRCGAVQALRPPPCTQCHSSNNMALDTRGSERISSFRWICRQCGSAVPVFGGWCPECQWPDTDPNLKRMDVLVHRAGPTFYAHTVVLLNIPHRQLDPFFNLPEWPAIVAGKFIGLPEVGHKPLNEFSSVSPHSHENTGVGLSGADLDGLLRRQASGELTPEQFVKEMEALRRQREQEGLASSPSGIIMALEQRTGVQRQVWERAGQGMLDAIMPKETGRSQELFDNASAVSTVETARGLGLSRLTLVMDFPIINASYGYSRAEYSPKQCRLNPFPQDREHGGKFPIFVDQVQADALMLSLDHNRVLKWLERNGFNPKLPNGGDKDLSSKAYFVRLFDNIPLRETLGADNPEARMVFGLLHTLSHISIRQAALLCGLDRTSLSEYVLPSALMFAFYSNHRFGATIGALTALFEQSIDEWLNAIHDAGRCVYDPVCFERESSCHACTHLPETSCRFFNLNLSRSLLFGGPDPKLGNISVGYLDSTLR
ncbi:hypothetical protein DEALK_06520 [Dehalogenimonas alkenigignens]|uniref:Uncharacterized protein n=1 Tax=Dehalogenimonas alkenigignens TaxID=1217799 RepID=A0A0W0GGY2_9CHLR|nr:hypothetical protein [Dehalogenimonas alkenigignens]KTB47807.1 hypothetical protein DEALK_06520 [Dehalogenimonas alkenigignens]